MSPEQQRQERHERHMRAMREFLIADMRDDLADQEEWLAAAKARGDDVSVRRYSQRIEELRGKLTQHEAELRAA